MKPSVIRAKLSIFTMALIAMTHFGLAKQHAGAAADVYKLSAIDRQKGTLTLQSNSQYRTVRVRADADITLNGAKATLDQLTPAMSVKVTFAEPDVVQGIEATGAVAPDVSSTSGTIPSALAERLSRIQAAEGQPGAAPSSPSALAAQPGAELAAKLANTTWSVPDATGVSSPDKWIRFNPDMTVTSSWFKHKTRTWKPVDTHSIQCVLNNKPHVAVLTFNADLSAATSDDGSIFRRMK